MAKETKQDRIVRQIMEQMTEHIAELKAFEASTSCKESDVEKWAQSLLKSCLGFSVTNGYTIKTQDTKGKHRPDIVVYRGEKPAFVMEVKKLGFDFEKSDFRSGKVQLKEYLSTYEDVPYGFLCNGYEWRLYDFSNKQTPIEIQKIDFKSDGILCGTSKKEVEEMCYEFVSFHESSYCGSDWAELSKEATAFSPDSLAKAILSHNVIKVITKEIRGEHEYKACTDLLYEKVFHLLSMGLDDTLKESFNPEKRLEFQKYIKSQMRQARKSKKPSKALEKVDQGSTEVCSSEQVETPVPKIEVA